MATRIGCDNLVYAIMTTEDTVAALPTYGEVKSAPGVMSININPNGSIETLFADDGPMEAAATTGQIEVEIQKNALTTDNKADLLGHTVDANGGVVYGDSDTPPWVAIGFRALKSNGKYRYTWLHKGKFSEPEDNNETKGDGINFQSDTITGNFAKIAKPILVATGKTKRVWKYEIDEEHEDANVITIGKWFEAPLFPSNTKDTTP
jgi:phi13 family phage major tail protein